MLSIFLKGISILRIYLYKIREIAKSLRNFPQHTLYIIYTNNIYRSENLQPFSFTTKKLVIIVSSVSKGFPLLMQTYALYE